MYTIKRAAELTGIGLPTLRAWERRYGVVAPVRSEGHYRLYSDSDVRALSIMAALVADGWTASEAAAETKRRVAGTDGVQRPVADSSLVDAPAVEPEGLDEVLAAAHDLDAQRLGHALDRGLAGVLGQEGDGSEGTDGRLAEFTRVAHEWLLPVLFAVGGAWADGRITPAGEHLVSNAVQRRLAALYDAEPKTTDGPLVVLALPAGARHELGLLAFAVGARRAGLRTAYLGADLPAQDWVSAVAGRRAGAAVLSVPRQADVAGAQAVIDRLRLDAPRAVVAVGGRHQDETHGALLLGHDLGDGVEALRSALEGAPVPS
ncbi:MerR family transcriptional regulator [Knoellia sp. CPCC 206450]|uniref:MerR family transcriptional regulator n=1 Tax=Knoellia tibetensis TaxID=3404798 RepID=UPI003B43AE8F